MATERPILFRGPLVRAILEGRKTQTRRPVKPQPEPGQEIRRRTHPLTDWWLVKNDRLNTWQGIKCPYGQPGDRLWVRETWCPARGLASCVSWKILMSPTGAALAPGIFYRADSESIYDRRDELRWRPSIHMPRHFSRLTLEITGVRAERLQDISEDDYIAEGVKRDALHGIGKSLPRAYFVNSWNATYGARGLGWDANPWVWVIEFRRLP